MKAPEVLVLIRTVEHAWDVAIRALIRLTRERDAAREALAEVTKQRDALISRELRRQERARARERYRWVPVLDERPPRARYTYELGESAPLPRAAVERVKAFVCGSPDCCCE